MKPPLSLYKNFTITIIIIGYLPGIFIMESIMEDIAAKLGKDPSDVRRANFYKQGQKNIAGDLLTYCPIEKLFADFNQWADIDERKAAVASFNKVLYS